MSSLWAGLWRVIKRLGLWVLDYMIKHGVHMLIDFLRKRGGYLYRQLKQVRGRKKWSYFMRLMRNNRAYRWLVKNCENIDRQCIMEFSLAYADKLKQVATVVR